MLGGMMQSIGIGGTVEASEMNISWLTFDNANERLGIGTTSPARVLSVHGANGGLPLFQIRNTSTSTDEDVFMSFNRDNSDTDGWSMGIDSATNYFKIVDDGNDLNTNIRLVIDDSGNVGIGTTQPLVELEVNGTIASKGGVELSVTSSTITATHNYHQVDTSGGAETVQTINGGVAGMILILKNANFNDLTFEDGIGNLRCASNSDVILNDNNSTITFIHDGGNWLQVATSDNS